MLNFTVEPKIRFRELLKLRYQHLPHENSILNGAYKFTGFETDEELHILTLKSIMKLEEEFKKRNRITKLIEEHISEFKRLYVRLPDDSFKTNVKNQLIDLFGEEILKYI